MNMIFVDGPAAILVGLTDIPDIILDLKSAEALPDGNLRVGAYATDRAVTEIESRGATVGIIEDNEALQGRLDELFAQIEAEPPVV